MGKHLKSFVFLIVLITPGLSLGLDNLVELPFTAEQIIARELPDMKNLNWQVGEYQNRRIKKGFAKLGTVESWVDREEGQAFWLINEVKIILQKKKVIEALIDRPTGEILKYIEDGEEKEAPDTTQLDDCQEISEVPSAVNVPAGKFEATQTVIRCPDESVAIWINHGEVNMGGHVRQALLGEDEDPQQPEYIVELEKFGKK